MSALKVSSRKEKYETYVTECLRFIVNNTSGQESRSIIKMSFSDIVNPKNMERIEGDNNKKAKDIIANIRNKLKGG